MAKVGRKKIRVEKPDWLEINKYKECKTFSAKQWGECLVIRRKILDSLYSIENEIPFNEHINACEEVLKIVRETPSAIISETIEKELYEKYPRGMSLFDNLFCNKNMAKKEYKNVEFKLNDAKLESFNVGSLSILEAIELKQDLEKILIDEDLQGISDSKSWYKRKRSKDGKEFDSEIIPAVDSILRESFDSKLSAHQAKLANKWYSAQSSRLHLTLSLTTTDKELKSQFDNWLSEARTKFDFSHESSLTNDSLHKLYRNQVLAFLDVQIWSIHEKTIVKFPQVYNWLFPKGGNEGRSRKVGDIKEIARYAISDNYLRLLLDSDLKSK